MALDYSGADVHSIELALQDARAGGWHRLSERVLAEFGTIAPRAGWVLPVPKGQFAAGAVERLYVLIDKKFPASEPRIVAPDLKLGEWPHVESGGVLCLRRTSWAATPGERVARVLADASVVLDYSEQQRAAEFAREFVSYWAQLATAATDAPLFLTLMPPTPEHAEIYFARMTRRNWIVLSAEEQTLRHWLGYSGDAQPKNLRRTRLHWLAQPWQPSHFPRQMRDITAELGAGALNAYLRPDESLPVLFGAATLTGNVFVGVDIPAVPRKQFKKGFRDAVPIPGAMIAAVSAGREVRRLRVERGDAAWIHGRDHNAQQRVLAKRSVGLIGCGALGSAIARLLAQMGVGRFVLVDGDGLTSANTSRHLLGAPYVGQKKATSVAQRLRRDFPDLSSVEGYPVRFQSLSGAQLATLVECDLLISAGIDWPGDVALDGWRRALPTPPAHLCVWTEEFALAGHAVALFGKDALLLGFSPDGVPHFRLTDWPETVKTKIVEAGCGNDFQPHGAVDLNDCTTLAAKLAVDVLTSVTSASCRRAWLGERAEVVRLGGVPRPEFNASDTRRVFSWPPAAS